MNTITYLLAVTEDVSQTYNASSSQQMIVVLGTFRYKLSAAVPLPVSQLFDEAHQAGHDSVQPRSQMLVRG
jgi:hypothetical protein